jgi:hypothetical protein
MLAVPEWDGNYLGAMGSADLGADLVQQGQVGSCEVENFAGMRETQAIALPIDDAP